MKVEKQNLVNKSSLSEYHGHEKATYCKINWYYNATTDCYNLYVKRGIVQEEGFASRLKPTNYFSGAILSILKFSYKIVIKNDGFIKAITRDVPRSPI